MLGLIHSRRPAGGNSIRRKGRTSFRVELLEDRRLLSAGMLPAGSILSAVSLPPASVSQPVTTTPALVFVQLPSAVSVDVGPIALSVQTGGAAPTPIQANVSVQPPINGSGLTISTQANPLNSAQLLDVTLSAGPAGGTAPTATVTAGGTGLQVQTRAAGVPVTVQVPGNTGLPGTGVIIPTPGGPGGPAGLPVLGSTVSGPVSQTATPPTTVTAPPAVPLAPPTLPSAGETGGGGGEAAVLLAPAAQPGSALVPPAGTGETARDSGTALFGDEDLAPVEAGPLTDVAPAVPTALQKVLEESDYLGARLSSALTTVGMAPWLLAAAAAAVALELARRRLRQLQPGFVLTGAAGEPPLHDLDGLSPGGDV